MLPVALNAAVAIFFSATIFPSTVSSFYISKCHGILLPLRSALQEHRRLLQTSTKSPEFIPTKANSLVAASEAGLIPVVSAIYLLKRDVVWCRFSPNDFSKLHEYARRMVIRVNGMCAYFGVIDPTRERFPTTPATPNPDSPIPQSLEPSQSPSVVHEDDETDITGSTRTPFEHTPTMDSTTSSTLDGPLQPGSIRNARRRNVRTRFMEHKAQSAHHEHIHHRPHHRHKHIPSHGPLLPLIMDGPDSSQPAVGLYEAIKYAGLEKKFVHPAAVCDTEKFHRLLRECCDDMLGVTDEALVVLDGWLNSVMDKSRFKFWRDREECKRKEQERLDELVQLKEKMDHVLGAFEKEKRCVSSATRSHSWS